MLNTHRPQNAFAVIVAALIVLGVVLTLRPICHGKTATRPAQSRPTTQASQPASKPAWNPPRFKARQADRDGMVQQIRSYGLTDKKVLDAMSAVPRHKFVPSFREQIAYTDRPLPIGYGQTISQPYIVAEMTRLLDLKPNARVLEIGTGSGYQAAVLTEFTPNVFTIEIVKPLAQQADTRLKTLGYTCVKVKLGDGYFGWEKHAPFDGIIVTAAAPQIPPPLVKQLSVGGKMIIPVGGQFATQWLQLVEKLKDGTIRTKSLMPVRFVPFVRGRTSEK